MTGDVWPCLTDPDDCLVNAILEYGEAAYRQGLHVGRGEQVKADTALSATWLALSRLVDLDRVPEQP
jgi:hypothetical protein